MSGRGMAGSSAPPALRSQAAAYRRRRPRLRGRGRVLSSAVPVPGRPARPAPGPGRFFGVFMSVKPVLAALVGLAILGQSLGWAEWLAIAAIVTANIVSVLTTDRSRA